MDKRLLPTQIVTPHMDGCLSVEAVKNGIWATPWELTEERVWKVVGDRSRGPMKPLLRLVCRDPNCLATMLVREDYLLGLLERDMDEKK